MRAPALAILSSLVLLLPACGGGGGSSPTPEPPAAELTTWATTLGTEDADAAFDTVMDAYDDGSAVVVQHTELDAVYGPGEPGERTLRPSNASERDAAIARYNADGTLRWLRTLGGPDVQAITGVAALPDGGVAVTGLAEGAATFGGGRDLQVAFEAPIDEIATFVMRLAADGELLWARVFATGADEVAPLVRYDATRDAVLLATLFVQAFTIDAGTPAEQDFAPLNGQGVFLASLLGGGKVQWAGQITAGDAVRVTDLRGAPGGDVVVLGIYRGTLFFDHRDPDAPVLLHDVDGAVYGFVAALDGDRGAVARSEALFRGDFAVPQRLAIRADGSLVIAGLFVDTMIVGVDHPRETRLDTGDDPEAGFLARVDAAGDLVFARTTPLGGSARAPRLALTPDGGIVFNVNTDRSVAFAGATPEENGEHIVDPDRQADALLVAFDDQGLYRGHVAHDGPRDVRILDLVRAADGTLLVLGTHAPGAALRDRDDLPVVLPGALTNWLARLRPDGTL